MNFREIKEKYRQRISDREYNDMFDNAFMTIFEYDEKIYRPEVFDWMLHNEGQCALINTETSRYTPVRLDFAGGSLMADGVLSGAICTDFAGHQWHFDNWLDNPDILVFFNDWTRSGDVWANKIAYLLTEADTSLNNNIIFSRQKPIPIADDDQTKKKIDKAMTDVQSGKIETVVTGTTLKDVVDGKTEPVKVLNLTDVDTSRYIQYLAHLHDALLSRFYHYVGIGMLDNGKQAQITIDELKRNEKGTFILPLTWYNCRKHGFKVAEEKTGEKWHFAFSELWELRHKELITSSEKEEAEIEKLLADANERNASAESIVNSNSEEQEEGEENEST